MYSMLQISYLVGPYGLGWVGRWVDEVLVGWVVVLVVILDGYVMLCGGGSCLLVGAGLLHYCACMAFVDSLVVVVLSMCVVVLGLYGCVGHVCGCGVFTSGGCSLRANWGWCLLFPWYQCLGPNGSDCDVGCNVHGRGWCVFIVLYTCTMHAGRVTGVGLGWGLCCKCVQMITWCVVFGGVVWVGVVCVLRYNCISCIS